jgi:hypothetical protein
MGFSISYKEVLRFEANAASSSLDAMLSDMDRDSLADHSLLLVADNADHNLWTLDGRKNFYAMCMIAAVTPQRDSAIIVPRLRITDLNIIDRSQIQNRCL